MYWKPMQVQMVVFGPQSSRERRPGGLQWISGSEKQSKILIKLSRHLLGWVAENSGVAGSKLALQKFPPCTFGRDMSLPSRSSALQYIYPGFPVIHRQIVVFPSRFIPHLSASSVRPASPACLHA
ncbi:hypothetical protein AAFF_G00189480 [Aldrovandia affinis]|uniref:Uncharacterized protein n=1 Tax=Aldrovandia affinis TaxID=143900 RepID=A0AAD7W6B8_9TELE|nr:hypothetical protein AAFF_G00189480 [Aldrovandia affinis]